MLCSSPMIRTSVFLIVAVSSTCSSPLYQVPSTYHTGLCVCVLFFSVGSCFLLPTLNMILLRGCYRMPGCYVNTEGLFQLRLRCSRQRQHSTYQFPSNTPHFLNAPFTSFHLHSETLLLPIPTHCDTACYWPQRCCLECCQYSTPPLPSTTRTRTSYCILLATTAKLSGVLSVSSATVTDGSYSCSYTMVLASF